MASRSQSHPGGLETAEDVFAFGRSSTTTYAEAEAVLQDLAKVFFENRSVPSAVDRKSAWSQLPSLEAKYRALVEQIPAVVFMAYLDEAVGEAFNAVYGLAINA